MRWKMPAGVLLALALLIPAAPAVAQRGLPKPAATSCQAIQYVDVPGLITINLDTATDKQVRVQAGQILTVANAEGLSTLAAAIQQRLSGTPDDLRTFLKTRVQIVWSIDLQIAVNRALAGGGTNVQTSAQNALDTATIDGYLAYLNHGLYLARARDCAL